MDNYYVFVRRHPYGHGPWDDGSEIPLDKMWDIKWDDEVGGVRTRTPTYFLMGKISWETARHLNIAVSGTHDYSNGIKVCIIRKYTSKEAWRHLIAEHGPSPDWGRRKNEAPCTRAIINQLEAADDHCMARRDLRQALQPLYSTDRIRRAIRRMTIDGRITVDGSSNSPSQKIYLSNPEQHSKNLNSGL